LLGILVLHVLAETSFVFVALIQTVDHLFCVVALSDSTILCAYQTIEVIISNLRVDLASIISFVLNSCLLTAVKGSHVDVHHLDLSIILSVLSCVLLQNLSHSIVKSITFAVLRSTTVFVLLSG